jgi:alpha-glucosidase (family GH31 glycosyl hydrolase)
MRLYNKGRHIEFPLIPFVFCFFLSFSIALANGKESIQNIVSTVAAERSIVFTSETGQRLKITPYGDYIIRVQAVRKDEDFFPDERYEMVESHNWSGALKTSDDGSSFHLSTEVKGGIEIHVSKKTMKLSFSSFGGEKFLREGEIGWNEDSIDVAFAYDSNEHFTGLGHGYYAREKSIDLRGEVTGRNYGSEHGQQAPLIVPFYLSSKGYGVFVNSTFPNSFDFGKDNLYQFSISGNGRMDFFVILGPKFSDIIDRYTQLTGRPRFPPKAVFGLALSDKGNDHTSSDPSDERWWKRKITEQRNAGFPFDHIINDNRWRAGGGKRCESYFAWDTTRFPDPREYERWIKSNGLYLTIDFNRCIASHSEGWKSSFNIPDADSIDFGDSAPDLTRSDVRKWFWNLFWTKSLNPALEFPGDALWIDEFDEMGKAPLTMVLGNGKTWREMKNYWFFLVAKALVQEGWDKSFKDTKRPFVWVRGMTAGAQRYASLWSGDIRPTYEDMKAQVRSMQLAGISGFPFWGHDAGGFYNYGTKKGPDDAMYRQWSMAFGSFSPFWKPHGVGQSRWPLDRSREVQKDAKKYCDLRYELMPYTYTYAHMASETGMPIARAMVIDHQNDSLAWQNDLEYMWGNEMLVAPNCSDSGNVTVWLPEGTWYDFWNDEQLHGNQTLSYSSHTGKLPLFVKAGSIIPMSNFALGTALIPNDSLTIHVYSGTDASFTLYEDDGVTEYYRTRNEKQLTAIRFIEKNFTLKIETAMGKYANAPSERAYRIEFHGLSAPVCFEMNGKKLQSDWDRRDKILSIVVPKISVLKEITIKKITDCP